MCVFAPSKTIEEVWRAFEVELKHVGKLKLAIRSR